MHDRYYRRLIWALVSCLLLAAVAKNASAEDAGISGVISVSPIHPGPQHANAESKAPAANVAFVVMKGTEKVASFTTDGEGRFQVSLPPGHYLVCRAGPGVAMGHWRFEVDVTAGKMARVDWTGDSGIR